MPTLRYVGAVAALAVVLAGCSARPVDALTPGECFTLPDDASELASVAVVDCAKPHSAEVFASFALAAGDFDADAIAAVADEQCRAEFEPYVGSPYSASDVYYRAFTPGEASWADGARTVVCFVVAHDGTLSGSVKKSDP